MIKMNKEKRGSSDVVTDAYTNSKDQAPLSS